jgi:hypothetical protein
MLARSPWLVLCLALSSATLRAQLPAPPEPAGDVALGTTHTEDWTRLKLSESKLPVQQFGGVLLSKVDLPGGCTRELLRMQWRADDPIDLYVIRPKGDGKLPVVLFLYNYTYDTDVFNEARWCGHVRENGFAVAGFPIALSFSRLHTPRPMGEWFVSELQESLATSTHDVQMVLNYLGSRPDLSVAKTGVFGQGSGASVAILAASVDPRIAALDLMDPWGDWPVWLRGSRQIPEDERATYLTPAFLAGVAGLDPISYLPQLQNRALRIQVLDTDPVSPPAAQAAIAAAAPAAVTRFPTRDAEAKALGNNSILAWLATQLGAKPVPADEGAANTH